MFIIPILRPGPRRRGLLSLLGALTLIASVACGSSASPTASPPSPSESQQSVDLGPLAVIDALGGSDARGGVGPVRIEDNCVTMTRENGDVLLLIWHSREVSWDEADREITFSSAAVADAKPITIRDGDTITVGGESLQNDEPPVTRNLVWLATPNATCDGAPWAVSSLAKS